MDEKPINWLASYPKSGATWLRLFLLAYLQYEQFDPNKPIDMGFMDTDDIRWSEVFPKSLDKLSQIENVLYRSGVISNSLDKWYNSTPNRKPLVKTHSHNDNMYGIPLQPEIFNAHSLYVVRDPRDVAVSLAYFFDINYDDAIFYLIHPDTVIQNKKESKILMLCGSWVKNIESWTQQPWVKSMRYEDLLENCKPYFKETISWIKWPWDENRYNYALEVTSFDYLSSFEDKHGFESQRGVNKFFRQGKSEQWKDELTKEQIKEIENNCKETMQKWGYL